MAGVWFRQYKGCECLRSWFHTASYLLFFLVLLYAEVNTFVEIILLNQCHLTYFQISLHSLMVFEAVGGMCVSRESHAEIGHLCILRLC